VNTIITILIYAVLLRALLSFIPHSRQQTFFRYLYKITDPLLKPFQRFQLGGSGFGIDLSPIFAIFALKILALLLDNLISFVGMGILR